MGGVSIQLLQVLRLRETLAECVASKAFCDLKKFKNVADIVMNERYWDLHYAVCKSLYPAHLLLRCADQKLGGMDRVKYLMLQIIHLLPKSIDDIVEKWSNLGEDNLKLIMCAKSDLEFDTPKMLGDQKLKGWMMVNLMSLSSFLCCITSSQVFG